MSPTPVIGIRVSEHDRDEIDRRASERRMSRSEYMIRAALDDLPGTASLEAQLAAVVKRVQRLEDLTFGT
jgi:hypothetical protein